MNIPIFDHFDMHSILGEVVGLPENVSKNARLLPMFDGDDLIGWSLVVKKEKNSYNLGGFANKIKLKK